MQTTRLSHYDYYYVIVVVKIQVDFMRENGTLMLKSTHTIFNYCYIHGKENVMSPCTGRCDKLMII